eukprot:evm.model.NODE_3566_length_12430_cov_33.962509.3
MSSSMLGGGGGDGGGGSSTSGGGYGVQVPQPPTAHYGTSPMPSEYEDEEEDMGRPRTFADLEEENDTFRIEVHKLRRQVREQEVAHAKEVKDLLYRLLKAEKRAAAAAVAVVAKGASVKAVRGGISDSEMEEVEREEEEEAAVAAARAAARQKREKKGDKSKKEGGEGRGGGQAMDVVMESEAKRTTRAAASGSASIPPSPARAARAAPGAAAARFPPPSSPRTKASTLKTARKTQESRLLRELKQIGAVDEEATNVREDLDVKRLVGLGMWKWFPADSGGGEGGGGGGARPKMLQFLGVFTKTSGGGKEGGKEGGEERRVCVEYKHSGEEEWWTRGELVDEYR